MVKCFLALSLGFSSAHTAGAAEEVRLAWARSAQCPPISGCYTREGVVGVIEVKNLAFEKVVEVVYQSTWNAATWFKTRATYLAPARDGFEAWSFEASGPVEAFALAYTVGGQTYWDNLGGQDYHNKRYGRDLHLGRDHPVALTSAYLSSENKIRVSLAVQGEGVQGERVKVHIAGGGQVQTADAEYRETYPSGVQYWEAILPAQANVPVERLKVAVQLGDFTDDNYGLYHKVTR